MTETIAIRPLAGPDTPSAERLLRASFESRLHPYIAYCQPGVARFLATTIEQARALPDYRMYAAEEPRSGQMVGFAEFRAARPGTDLLSYICISPAARGRQLAERMIRNHLEARPATQQLELDVFAHNRAARTLYERLGFEEVGSTAWWSRPARHGDEAAHVRFIAWQASMAAMTSFGFSMLSLETDRGVLTVGHPSPSVVRLPDFPAFRDDSLLTALRHAIPTLEYAMLTAPHPHAEQAPGAHVLDSLRLRSDTSQW